MTPTVEQLKHTIADVLEKHSNDLISATRAGRIFALLGASDVEPHGGFAWKVVTMDLADLRQIPNGAVLEISYAAMRDVNSYPVLIVGSDRCALIGRTLSSNNG